MPIWLQEGSEAELEVWAHATEKVAKRASKEIDLNTGGLLLLLKVDGSCTKEGVRQAATERR